MVQVSERYTCEKCGTTYRDRGIAELCERGAEPKPPKFNVGDSVSFEVDHSIYDDQIRERKIGPGIVGNFTWETGADAERLALLDRPQYTTHEWRYYMHGGYDHDGVQISFFDEDHLKVIKQPVKG